MSAMGHPLVAVDWGTSSLRVALIDAAGHVLHERAQPRGILTVAAGEFPSVLQAACGDWLQGGTLCLVSGMAGSRQGWLEAPYCPCPAGFADLAARLAWVEPGRIAIVPGLSCEQDGVPDVMRGEEVQVFGALRLLGLRDARLVLPGTHSKWVNVADGRIEHFSTWMTGEFFALLRQHSILARGMPADEGVLEPAAFEQGVHHAMQAGNLLHAAFSARTLGLFDRLAATALPSYLSGLVIGEELRSQPLGSTVEPVVVMGAPALARRYELALRSLGVATRVVGAQATWQGLWALSRQLEARA